jgi:hypothetical protein
VAGSALILRHVQEAWDSLHAEQDDALFCEQEVMVTVPASFDETARELTLSAAGAAGFESVVLLEEPQAAFYAWIESHPAGQRKKLLRAGNTILVFDVGGGTTDFTLIRVDDDGESFERTAVGDHLLLGGDNIDLTLAVTLERRLAEKSKKKLDTMQWHGLVHSCRLAKEKILGQESVDEVAVSVAGRGAKLIGGSLKGNITRDELLHILDEGFFPRVVSSALPQGKASGLQEFGLPYAADPAITKHLAHFLARHHVDHVDAVLFNGGAMTPAPLRARVLDQLEAFSNTRPKELANQGPEMAVAKGAAYYGMVRRGLGSRIRGGTPRTFYVGVEVKAADKRDEQVVCLAPKGLEEGSVIELEHDFELLCNRPVSFKLFSSSTRNDAPGDLARVGDGLADDTEDGSDLLELAPIVTVLRAPGRSKATVRLEVRITELGALEIWCHDQGESDERWRLSFDMRAGGAKAQTSADDVELGPRVPEACELLQSVFSDAHEIKPPGLVRALEGVLEERRDEWNTATARALFDAALKIEETRKTSPEHEARWLNLCGFCLRPGNGAPLDEWRIKQMWRIFNEGQTFEKHEACRLAWWILWRRIAGGMSKGQQEQIYDRLAQLFLPSAKQKKKWHQIKPSKQEAAEMWRTLANLERLPSSHKIKLGDELIRRLETRKGRQDPLHFWALGRIGERVPLYGPLNAIVPAQRANEWLKTLLDLDWPDPDKAAFPMAQLGRKTGDRARDIDETLRPKLSQRLRSTPGGERSARLVDEIVELEAREERVALGDTLPAGLRLVSDSE